MSLSKKTKKKSQLIFFIFYLSLQQKTFEAFKPCIDEPSLASPSSRFIILSSRTLSHIEISSIQDFFQGIKRLNVAVFFEREIDGSMATEAFTLNVLHHTIHNCSPSTDVDEMFPDKLTNLN